MSPVDDLYYYNKLCFFICCSQDKNFNRILDELKDAYFATHGASFPLTGNKEAFFKNSIVIL